MSVPWFSQSRNLEEVSTGKESAQGKSQPPHVCRVSRLNSEVLGCRRSCVISIIYSYDPLHICTFHALLKDFPHHKHLNTIYTCQCLVFLLFFYLSLKHFLCIHLINNSSCSYKKKKTRREKRKRTLHLRLLGFSIPPPFSFTIFSLLLRQKEL